MELTGNTSIVTSELREQGQFGIGIDIPGQAGRNVVAFVIDMIDLSTAVAYHTTEAIKELPFLVDLPGTGEVNLTMVVAAVLDFDFIARLFAGAAADHVQHATRWSLAVYRRCRSAQQGEAIEIPGFLLGVGIHAFW
ncbi:hypothetical protein D3C77_368040 [compost metagenome]